MKEERLKWRREGVERRIKMVVKNEEMEKHEAKRRNQKHKEENNEMRE